MTAKTVLMALFGACSAISLYAATADCWVKSPADCVTVSTATVVQTCTVGSYSGKVTSASDLDMCAKGSPGNKECDYSGGSRDCSYVCTWTDSSGNSQNTTQTQSQNTPVLGGDGC